MLSHPATILPSNRTLNHLASRIRIRLRQHRSRWRRLDPVLTIAHLRHLRPPRRRVRHRHRHCLELRTRGIDLLAAGADDLATVMVRVRMLSYVILNGTLIPIGPVADQGPSCRPGDQRGSPHG